MGPSSQQLRRKGRSAISYCLWWLLASLVVLSIVRIFLSQDPNGEFFQGHVDSVILATDQSIRPHVWDLLLPAPSTNNSDNDNNNSLTTAFITDSNEEDSQQQSPKFAYAFVIWSDGKRKSEVGTTTTADSGAPPSYGPYLANVLIATKVLRQWGSKADIVVMLQLSSTTMTKTTNAGNSTVTTTLSNAEEQMLEQFGIHIHYLPPPPPPATNLSFLQPQDSNKRSSSSSSSSPSSSFQRMFAKFHVWNLTQYDRVLYLDSDVLPLQNLDYLLEQSWRGGGEEGGLMAPTVVIAGWMQPASGGLFVLQPNATDFQQLQRLIQNRLLEETSAAFDPVQGWGHVISPSDAWETNLPWTSPQTNWTFFAAEYDQGLLYYYAKYVLRNMTQILATKVVHYFFQDDGATTTSTSTTPFQQEQQQRHQWQQQPLVDSLWTRRPSTRSVPFFPDNCFRMMTGNRRANGAAPPKDFYCLAPYSDWSHFTGEAKPWLWPSWTASRREPPPRSVWHQSLPPTTDTELWWKTLRDLAQQDHIDITQLLPLETFGTPLPLWLKALVKNSQSQNITNNGGKKVDKLFATVPNASLWTNHTALGGDWNPTTSSTFFSLSPPKSRFAYAFMIWNCQPEPEVPDYRPYLANMMISAKLLHEKFGSESDVVALIKLKYKSNHTRLRPEDEAMLQRYNIRIMYLPKTPGAHGLNGTGISDMMTKFMVWNLTEYQRVLYLDSDVMPLTNLDYLFHLSVQGIICPTVVVAGYLQPANGGFVILEPNTTDFDQLQHIIHTMPRSYRGFDIVNGFGHKIEPPDLWETNRRSTRGTNWTFYAAHTDQGLLYHYPKYVQKRLTNIFSRKIVNYGSDESGRIRVEREWTTTSHETSLFYNVSHTVFDFYPGNCHKVTGRFGKKAPSHWPGCVPPYNHYHHFTGSDKPWLSTPPHNVWKKNKTAYSSTQLWWQMIRELEVDGIDIRSLGLKIEKVRG